MAKLGDLDVKIRSKNAGPFWITADIFCKSRPVFHIVKSALSKETLASCLFVEADSLLRFEIDKLYVLKFSLPRPNVQGSRKDRDMHGAQLAVRLAEIELGG